jgi:hypothetical protein
MAVARYDGHADWYDAWRGPHVESNALDVGLAIEEVAELGNRAVPNTLALRARKQL